MMKRTKHHRTLRSRGIQRGLRLIFGANIEAPYPSDPGAERLAKGLDEADGQIGNRIHWAYSAKDTQTIDR